MPEVSQMEAFLLAMAVYIMEYRLLAAANIVATLAILWLLVKRYSDRIRTIMHAYFAVLSFYPALLLNSYMTSSLRDIDGLRARAAKLGLPTHFPEAMFFEVSMPPRWLQNAFYLTVFVLIVSGSILWLYDIKKKQTVYDYTGMPRWQKYLTWFLVFYGLTYLHAMMFGWFLGGVFDIYLMYGLYPCPINLVLVALLAPLVPRVNKPLYVVICLMAISGAFYNQMIGLSVNLDALAVSPAGIYGLVMLWRSTRRT